METTTEKLTMTPDLFNKVEKLPIGLGMGKIEYEELACILLNRHIEQNLPFDQPTQCSYDHSTMVGAGWLEDHGDRKYTLTKKSLGLLWAKYSK